MFCDGSMGAKVVGLGFLFVFWFCRQGNCLFIYFIWSCLLFLFSCCACVLDFVSTKTSRSFGAFRSTLLSIITVLINPFTLKPNYNRFLFLLSRASSPFRPTQNPLLVLQTGNYTYLFTSFGPVCFFFN